MLWTEERRPDRSWVITSRVFKLLLEIVGRGRGKSQKRGAPTPFMGADRRYNGSQ